VWTGATFVHDATTAGKCNTCHKSGGTGLAMTTPPHIPVGTIQCDVCHSSSAASFVTRTMNHAAVTATPCATCHSGTYKSENADPVGTTHIPLLGTAKTCNACHTSQTVWTARTMDHTGLAAQCSTCHMGGFVSENAQKFSATHPAGQTPAQCDSCHNSTTVWTGAAFVHPATAAGTCNTCHKSGGPGLAMNTATHIPVAATQCDVCHTSTSSFTVRSMKHTAVTATPCATCHSAIYSSQGADPVGTTHIPLLGTAKTCNACHTSQTVWTQRTMDHGGLTSQCSTCHKGAYVSENALTYSATHAGGQTPAQCDSCHKSTVDWSSATTFAHDATTVGKCNTCHKTGGAGLAMNTATHIPVGALQCDQCHTSTATFTAYIASFHGVVAATPCATCHSGTYKTQGNNGGAQGKSTLHIPYEANLLAGSSMTCNACHASTTAWTVSKINHNNTQGNGAGWCIGCHQSGKTFSATSMQKKSVTHQKAGSTDCSMSGCHRPLGNKGTAYSNWD
jgi:hypothetical protein